VAVDRDGSMSSRENGVSSLLDRVNGAIDTILSYEDLLVPLSARIDRYAHKKSSANSSVQALFLGITRDFKLLTRDYFPNASDEEEIIYQSIAANIGIELCRIRRLEDDKFPDAPDIDTNELKYEGKIAEFFVDFRNYVDQDARPDYDQIAKHLHYILSKDYENPVEMMDRFENEYHR
jgi:hypothetical protein